MTVAVLFARQDSYYKTLPNVDVYDIDRDARTWPGGCPVVAHPPCRAWGLLRQFAKPRPDEKQLAIMAVQHVQQYGGVLEHPARSSLWNHMGLPKPGEFEDEHGGYSIEIEQFHFGHKAEKLTWLYIVGNDELAPIPVRVGKPTHVVRPKKNGTGAKIITKPEREHTPPALAEWLVDLASRCKVTA